MRRAVEVLCVVIVGVASVACGPDADRGGVDGDPAERERRQDALARAKVFRTAFNPDVLAARPELGIIIDCRFLLTDVSGTSPKFDCELPDKRRVKVKYGANREISGEIAATRLLTALGFGADRVVLAGRVRCYGCPASPFYSRRLANWTHLEGLLRRTRDYDEYHDFEWTSVEHKLEGDTVETDGQKGWSFHELSEIDASRGGATRHEVDALRLIAVFLAHWDNKAANQRLICQTPRTSDERCRGPLAMLQDLGATFGPRKVNLSAWRKTPIWSAADSCRVSMEQLPHDGATFVESEISEGGRRLLADRLVRLTPAHIRTLFLEAKFPNDADEWVSAFRQKVDEIAERTCRA
jgi:hypothetical protein